MRLLSNALELRVDGRPVALTRMLLAFAAAVCVIESAAVLRGVAAGKLRYPTFDAIPAPDEASVHVYLVAGLAASTFLLLGLLAAASAALGSALLAGALIWDQQTYSNHHLLVALLLAYLVFAQSGNRWGLDGLRRPAGADVRWWPQLLMMTQTSVLYVFAGLSKLNPVFLSGEPLQGWMWLDLPVAAFQLLALATALGEMALALALWLPQVRRLAVMAGIGLHAGIIVFMPTEPLVFVAFGAAAMASYWLFLTRPSLRPSREPEPAID